MQTIDSIAGAPGTATRSRTIRAVACLVYAACVVILSLAPPATLPGALPPLPAADKLVHIGLYALFALLVHWALTGIRIRHRTVAGIVAMLSAFGLGMEILQPAVSGGTRCFEWADALANTIGACAGWSLAHVATRRG